MFMHNNVFAVYCFYNVIWYVLREEQKVKEENCWSESNVTCSNRVLWFSILRGTAEQKTQNMKDICSNIY